MSADMLQVGGIRLELGKPQSDAAMAYFYQQKTSIGSTLYSIMSYDTTPNASLFSIPTVCKKNESQWKLEGLY